MLLGIHLNHWKWKPIQVKTSINTKNIHTVQLIWFKVKLCIPWAHATLKMLIAKSKTNTIQPLRRWKISLWWQDIVAVVLIGYIRFVQHSNLCVRRAFTYKHLSLSKMPNFSSTFLQLFLLLVGSSTGRIPSLILDTDMDFDVDDVGALCLAHSLQVYTYSFQLWPYNMNIVPIKT